MSSLPIVRAGLVHSSCAAVLTCGAALAAAACGGGSGAAAESHGDAEAAESGPIVTGSTPDGSTAETSTSVDTDAGVAPGSGSDGASLATVSGHVVAFPTAGLFPGPSATPIAGRRVTLLDAGGKKLQALTDSSGAFQVDGVALPYDALVDAPQGTPASNSVPTAFLSIGTVHPRLIGQAELADGGAADGSAPSTWRQATLDVPLQFPPCPSASCGFALFVVDHLSGASLSGATSTYWNLHASFTFPFPLQWYGGPSAAADVYVLAFDQALSTYWYGSYLVGVPVQDQGTSQMPLTVAPTPLATIGTFTATVTSSDVPAAWGAPNLDVFLAIPGTQQLAPLAQVQSTSVAMQVPNLLGATLSAQASVEDPNASDPRTWSAASASALPLTTGTEMFTLPQPLTVTSPAYGATVSPSKGGVLSWTGSPKVGIFLVSFAATGDAGATDRLPYVLTSNSSIDLARLTELGGTLTPGPTIAPVDCMGEGASLDAILDESTLALPDSSETSGTEWRFVVAP